MPVMRPRLLWDRLIAPCAAAWRGHRPVVGALGVLLLLASLAGAWAMSPRAGAADGSRHAGTSRAADVPTPGSAPVRVRHGDSRQVLATMAAAGETVDVVLLDPMFTDPRASDTGFALARGHAVGTPLSPEWVALARAVARRWVVVTAERARPWFPEAGLERLEGTRSGRWFRTRPSRHRG